MDTKSQCNQCNLWYRSPHMLVSCFAAGGNKMYSEMKPLCLADNHQLQIKVTIREAVEGKGEDYLLHAQRESRPT